MRKIVTPDEIRDPAIEALKRVLGEDFIVLMTLRCGPEFEDRLARFVLEAGRLHDSFVSGKLQRDYWLRVRVALRRNWGRRLLWIIPMSVGIWSIVSLGLPEDAVMGLSVVLAMIGALGIMDILSIFFSLD